MRTLRRVWALAAFSVRTNLGRWSTRLGALAGLAVVGLGPVLSLHRGEGWRLETDLAFFGVFTAALFLLRSGLEEQRQGGLDTFLRMNWVSPVEHAMGTLVSLLVGWALLCLGAFAAMTALGGGVADSAWLVSAWGLRSLLILGAVPVVESVAALGLPFIVPALGYFGSLLVLTVVLGEAEAMALFIPIDLDDPRSLLPLLRQALVVFTATSLLFVAATGASGWIARLRKFVPSRHGGAPPRR